MRPAGHVTQISEHRRHRGAYPDILVRGQDCLAVLPESFDVERDVIEHRGAAGLQHLQGTGGCGGVGVLGVAVHVGEDDPRQPDVERQVGCRAPVERLPRVGMGVDHARHDEAIGGIDHSRRWSGL